MTQNIMCHFLLLSVLYLPLLKMVELRASSLHPFVVKTVQIQRSPIFDAMGHTSVFPIAENEVAEVVVLFSPQK